MGMTNAIMRLNVLIDLAGATDDEWSQAEIDRCIDKAVADLSRFLPQQLVWEKTLDYTEVTDEQVTLTAHGTYKDLANKPVEWDSERICDDAAETTKYTRDTDYTIDYMSGKITSISGGSIGATDIIYCNYTVSKIAVDISGITDLIRVDRVEYPAGNVPQTYISPNIWGDFLIVEGSSGESQAQMSDKKHLVVYYHAEHTAPTESAAGTHPAFLDNTVVLAAAAYALFHKAAEAEHQAVDDLTSMRTELGLTTAIHALIATALGKVATHAGDADSILDLLSAGGTPAVAHTDVVSALDLVTAAGTPATAAADVNTALDAAVGELVKANAALDKMDNAPGPNLTDANAALDKVIVYLENNSNEDAKTWLEKITADIAGLRTAFLTAIDAANSYLDEVDSTDLQGAEAVWADEEMHIRENITAGLCTSDSAFQLTDSTAPFTAADVGKIVHNLTDDTWGHVVKFVSTSVLDLSSDLFPDGDEEYALFHANMENLIAEAIRYVNKITTGADVPVRLAQLAALAGTQQTAWRQKRLDWIALGGARATAALGFIQEANVRLSNLRTYVEQATGWMSVANGFAGEAARRVDIALAWVQEADRRNSSALGYINEAAQRIGLCQVYLAEADRRLAILDRYLGEADRRLGMCTAYTEEANSRLAEIDRLLAEANQYFNASQADLVLADQFRKEAIERRTEVWAIWRDSKQYVGDFSYTAVQQPGKYD